MSVRKGLKEKASYYENMFAGLLNKKVEVRYKEIVFTTVLNHVRLGKGGVHSVTKFLEANKRTDENGKQYTPPFIEIGCDDGLLFFVIEDILDSKIYVGGVALVIGGTRISFSEV